MMSSFLLENKPFSDPDSGFPIYMSMFEDPFKNLVFKGLALEFLQNKVFPA